MSIIKYLSIIKSFSSDYYFIEQFVMKDTIKNVLFFMKSKRLIIFNYCTKKHSKLSEPYIPRMLHSLSLKHSTTIEK